MTFTEIHATRTGGVSGVDFHCLHRAGLLAFRRKPHCCPCSPRFHVSVLFVDINAFTEGGNPQNFEDNRHGSSTSASTLLKVPRNYTQFPTPWTTAPSQKIFMEMEDFLRRYQTHARICKRELLAPSTPYPTEPAMTMIYGAMQQAVPVKPVSLDSAQRVSKPATKPAIHTVKGKEQKKGEPNGGWLDAVRRGCGSQGGKD